MIYQISQKWKVRNETLTPCKALLVDLSKSFTYFTYTYLPREDNLFVNALAKLASIYTYCHQFDSINNGKKE